MLAKLIKAFYKKLKEQDKDDRQSWRDRREAKEEEEE